MTIEGNLEDIKIAAQATVRLMSELVTHLIHNVPGGKEISVAGHDKSATTKGKGKTAPAALEQIKETPAETEKPLGETDHAAMFLKVGEAIKKMASDPGTRGHAVELLNRYGAKKGGDLKPDQYARFLIEINKKQAELDAPDADDLT